MTAISPSQLNFVAAFLEKSRDYLGIEHTIRLAWPHRRNPNLNGQLSSRIHDGKSPKKPGQQNNEQRHMQVVQIAHAA